MLNLKKLEIAREREWDTNNQGPLVCNITFRGASQVTTLVLDDEISRRLVAICAEEIKKAADRVANEITAEVIESVDEPKKLGEA